MTDLTNVPSIRVHLYECQSCVASFAGEDHEELDHSEIKCPFCGGEDLDDVGYGVVVITSLPEFEEGAGRDEEFNDPSVEWNGGRYQSKRL